MKSDVLISVIIPLYNAEKYIEKCVNSFLLYDSDDFEIIIVDDGSTDNSLQICERMKKTDKRLKIFHITNSGASVARNVGIENSRGKYIFFCDSDDYIETDEFKKVIKSIQLKESDLYVFNKCNEGIDDENYFVDEIGMLKGYTKDLSEIYKFALQIRISAPWKKIYKASILKKNKTYFPKERIIHEDLSQFLQYLKYCENACVLEENIYYHRYTENSLSKQIKFKMFYDIVNTFSDMEELVKEKDLDFEYLNFAKNRYLAIIMGIIVRMKINKISNYEINKNIKKSNLNYIFKKIRLIGKDNYVRYFFYRLKFFKIYNLLYKKRKERNDKKI